MDLIDRQAAIRAVNTALFPKINTAKDAEKALRDLPSAQLDVPDTNVGDMISRQAAIDAADRADYTGLAIEDVKKVTDEVVKEIKKLPSAQPEYRLDEWCTDCKEYDTEKHCCPRFNQVIRTTLNEMKSERKKGKWIHGKCSNCGEHAPFWAMASTYYKSNFCPNCGARMTEEDV